MKNPEPSDQGTMGPKREVSGSADGIRPQRRVRGSLTRDEIAVVALDLLDRDGMESVTMRQIADELGVAVMSLYVHVRNKREIHLAVVNRVLSELPPVDSTAEPDAAVRQYFETFHDKMVDHPSVASIITSAPILGPDTFASMNSLFAVLAAAGLSDIEAVTATTSLTSFTLGFTVFATARNGADPNVTEDRNVRLRGIDPDAFPALHKVRERLLDGPSIAQFRDGLTRLTQSYLPRTASPATRPT